MERAGAIAVRLPGDSGRVPARVVRGALVGLVSGSGASIAHQVAGGHTVPGVTAVVTLLAVAIGVAAARRRFGAAESVALAALAQAASHLLMVSGAHAHGSSPHDTPAMLVPHAVVALVTAALVHRCDRAVLGVVAAVVAWLLPRLTGPVQHPSTGRPAPAAESARRRTLPSRIGYGQVNRRGPPTAPQLILAA